MQYAEIDDAELAALKSTDVQYGCAVAMNPPPKASAQVHKTAPSGLSSQQLLPCYQVFLGDIPTRINRSISPVPPHPIKAPSMEPRPMPTPPNLIQRSRTPVYATPMTTKCTEDPKTCTSKQVCSRSDCVAKQAQTSSSTSSQSSKTVSQTSVRSSVVSSRSARTTSPLAGKPSTVSNAGKQTFKPDIPARSLSPSWKADYVRSVQNLSPITVRLPSPVPPPTKPKGELTQTTTANVTVKNTKQKTTTASQRPATTQSTRPPVGPCGTSKGCGTPPGSPTGRRSPIGPCGTSKGCGTPPPSPTGRRSPAGERVNESYHSMMQMGSMRIEDSRGWDSNNKENITASVVQGSKTAMAYSTKTTSSATTYENRSSAQKNQLVGILKKTMSGADTNNRTLSSIGNQPKRTPLTPATLPTNVTSWSATPLPPNLPLPRNCGVNPSSSGANAGGAGGLGGGRSSIAGSTAPRRGRGVLNAAVPAGGRVPLCGHCNNQIRCVKRTSKDRASSPREGARSARPTLAKSPMNSMSYNSNCSAAKSLVILICYENNGTKISRLTNSSSFFRVKLKSSKERPSAQTACSGGLYRPSAQIVCTECLYRPSGQASIQTICTDRLYRPSAQTVCTENLHRPSVQKICTDCLCNVCYYLSMDLCFLEKLPKNRSVQTVSGMGRGNSLTCGTGLTCKFIDNFSEKQGSIDNQ
ncbi:unnamed protein product [Nesidiocoris tenuis]|uniref:Uncharacterized protein n=1 Tax=Nesidiocoris tenuis TaxID=355587 RepID=A0A6H5H362_9HEMI|nr:unnamed protein product [Nesidiocoris tenuis]